MAAGTSEQMVPQLFDDLIDSDSSSSSDYCSVASDSCGIVDEGSFPLYKDSVMGVLRYLDYRDEVSLMFLLADDMKTTLQKLLRPESRPRQVLADWLTSQQDGCWENKLIESLCITQNYQVLGSLVRNVTCEENRFDPQSPQHSVFVNRTRKALYLMCEALCAEELDELVQEMIKCTNLYRKFPCELMELYLMYWSCSLGDASGREVDLRMLKSVLNSMNKHYLAVSLDSSAPHRDGPAPADASTSTCSSMRLNTNLRLSAHVSVQSIRASNFYKVDPNNVGVCLIINQKLFHKEPMPRFQNFLIVHGNKKLETREGTDVDRDRLWEVFRSMGFTIYVEENLTHLQILSTVRDVISTKVNSKHSCFALCILSHGAEGIVSGSNSVAVYREELEQCLTEAPSLIGKPKLMILQVCQGEKLQNVVYCEDDMVAVDGPTVRTIGASADILTFWSTMPGYASIRDKKRGTWFVEALWQQLMSARSNEDMIILLTKVTNAVTSRCVYLEDGYKTMVPEQCNRLTKSLVLPQNPKHMLQVAMVMFERLLFESLKKQYESSRQISLSQLDL